MGLRASVFLLAFLPSCGEGPTAAPPLAELISRLCPEGPVAVTRFAEALPDEAALIADRIERSTGEDFDKWMQADRPYSPAYGVTAAEFDLLRRAWSSEERVLLTLDDHVIEYVHKPGLSRIIAGVELATLNDLELHADADMIRTFWGDLQPGEALSPDYPEGHRFHGYRGRRWSQSEGSWESSRKDAQGSARMLEFWLMSSPDDTEVAVYFRVASRRSGITYVDDEVLLHYLAR